jgi:hypothetical protein
MKKAATIAMFLALTGCNQEKTKKDEQDQMKDLGCEIVGKHVVERPVLVQSDVMTVYNQKSFERIVYFCDDIDVGIGTISGEIVGEEWSLE